MRSDHRSLVRIVCLLCIACGPPRSVVTGSGDGGGTMGDAGTGDAGMSADSGMPADGGGMMTTGIPPAGTVDQVDNNFGDVEPNNTPQEATPLGVAMSGSIYVWVDTNAIGGPSNPADYFVFETPAQTGTFSFDICFGTGTPLTALSASLWKVVGGEQQLPAIGTWQSSGGCVTDMTAAAPLEASTEYLFGLEATGGVGSYSA